MTFRDAVTATPHLQMSWRDGLQALRARDKRHVKPDTTIRLRGSVDVDSALKAVDPHGHRWDYGIAYQHTDRKNEFVYWVELHTAGDHEVDRVIAKARWLLRWLETGGKRLAPFEREIVWVSSGATAMTLSATQRKRMAISGLAHRGSTLRIRDQRGP